MQKAGDERFGIPKRDDLRFEVPVQPLDSNQSQAPPFTLGY